MGEERVLGCVAFNLNSGKSRIDENGNYIPHEFTEEEEKMFAEIELKKQRKMEQKSES